jgi:hypothetical protein
VALADLDPELDGLPLGIPSGVLGKGEEHRDLRVSEPASPQVRRAKGIGSPSLVMFVIRPVPEIEHVEKIADRRAVHRHVGIVSIGVRVREIVAAAMGEPTDVPIALDELQDRDMVGIAVHNTPAL